MSRRFWMVILALAMAASDVLAGSAAVTNKVNKFVPDGTAFRDLQIDVNDAIVTELDSDEDRLDAIEAGTLTNGITMLNGETLDNDTDAKVRVTYNDDAAVLGEFILESDNAETNVADNDAISVIAKANDDATNKTEFASIDFVYVDVTDSTEDGSIVLKAFVGGTERTLATFASAIGIGASQVTAITFTTDGTGDGEIVLPANSIGEAEMDLSTVTGGDLSLLDCGRIVTTNGDSASAPALTVGTSTNGLEDVSSSQLGIVMNGTRIGYIGPDGLHIAELHGYLSGKGAEIQYSSWDYTTNAITLGDNDLNQIQWINTNTTVAITLPTNGCPAGSWVDIGVHSGASDDCAPTISAATADTLITPNSADSDSVTWGTGHRIGAYARFVSDGAFWHVQNLGGTTMTVNDSD